MILRLQLVNVRIIGVHPIGPCRAREDVTAKEAALVMGSPSLALDRLSAVAFSLDDDCSLLSNIPKSV